MVLATPREQLLKYSTQLTYSTATAPTFSQILNDIDLRLPNAVASSDKIRWLNNTVSEVWKWVSSTRLYSTTTIAETAIYPLSTDMRYEKIKGVFKSDSTARSSTENYTEYFPVGVHDTLAGNKYYKAGNGIGIYPVPTTNQAGYALKVLYEAIPPIYSSTTDTTSVPRMGLDHVDVLKWRVLKDVALAGNAPDVTLANSYDAAYEKTMQAIKMDFYRRKTKTPDKKWNYKSGWHNG